MSEPLHPFLPKRRSGRQDRFRVPASIGAWEQRPNTDLNSLAEAIETPPVRQQIYSIPDPWARAILFDRALRDSEHIIHRRILGEWRGLLAILGLRDRRHYKGLTVGTVDLNQTNGSTGSFASILGKLQPREDDLLSTKTTWEKFHILRWQLKPFAHTHPRAFAFTSPMTLVATGANYSSCLNQAEVPWFNGELLVDPTDSLSQRERKALAEWVLGIVKELSRELDLNSSRKGVLLERLRNFAQDLDHKVKSPEKVEDTLGADGLGLHEGVFRLIDRPRRAETQIVSDLRIVTDRPGAQAWYLIEPSVTKQWNEHAREIAIYGDISLDRADHFTAGGEDHGQIAVGQNWCTAAYFFSDRLIYSQDPGAFPGCLPMTVNGSAEGKAVVFPLSSVSLTLFTPEELQSNSSITWLQQGGAVVRLTIRLREQGDGAGKERICRIEKTYSQDEIVLLDFLPVVAVWPNFRLHDESWKLYTFQGWISSSKEELVMTPWIGDKEAPMVKRPHKFKPSFQVTRTSGYPEAFACRTPYFDKARHREVQAEGLLLLQLPAAENPTDIGGAVLGVDFGSTASDVFRKVGAGEPEPIRVRDRTVRITNFDNLASSSLREWFIPNQDKELKNILSVFHDFGDPPLADGRKSERFSLLDGHVLYQWNGDASFVMDPARIRGNLKWGEERERIAAREFVLQLCLQACAELVVDGIRDVEIRFSYPTAFSSTDISRFHANWKSIVKELGSGLTGLNVHQNLDQREDGRYLVDNREAIAATRFFAKGFDGGRMDVGGGALIVDIGGGTTDIAVWKDFKLLSHSSVIFAGRDIFLAPLRRKPMFLKTIEAGIHESLLTREGNEAAFNARIDAVISHHGEEIIEKLPIKEADPSVRGFLKLLTIGLCGTGFYAGLLVRRLLEANVYVPGRQIQIFFGGNGSKIFRWCALDHFSRDSDISQKFVQAFKAGANGLADVRVGLNLNTSAPKIEVAYGLVGGAMRLDVHDEFAAPIGGEAYLYKEGTEDKAGSWSEAPPIDRILDNSVRVDNNLPVFSSFLKSIGESADPHQMDRIAGEVNTSLADLSQQGHDLLREDPQASKAHLLRNEPMFIVALKRYLANSVEEWVRRA